MAAISRRRPSRGDAAPPCAVSPIRAIATVRRISTGTYKKAFSTTGAAGGWVGETAARPQTDSPTLAELSFPAMELYAMPAATQTLLDDAIVNIDQWIAEEVESAFAEQESAAFVNGDGVNKPKGFLAYPTVAEASWSWGNIGYLATGRRRRLRRAPTRPTSWSISIYALKARLSPERVLRDEPQDAGRRAQVQGARPATISGSRRRRSGAGDAAWASRSSRRRTCRTSPRTRSRSRSAISAAAISSSIGAGVRVLRDPYSAKPYVLFYTTKRVGGGVQDFDAIKLLKFDVS